jgi:uncharacterized SAM-binding protein YcdF (DUF218 family)
MGSSRPLFRRLALSTLRVVLLGWLVAGAAVFLWGQRDAAVPSDAIVVLGAAQYAGRPSPVLRARLDHAFLLWKDGLAPRVILTGGKAEGDVTTEAAVGRNYLRRRGVPDSAMMLEKEGRSTEESLDGVARLMGEHDIDRVILVSDPFHMLRLQILAWRHALHAVPSPTRTSPISANRTEAMGYIMGESVKVPFTLAIALASSVGR